MQQLTQGLECPSQAQAIPMHSVPAELEAASGQCLAETAAVPDELNEKALKLLELRGGKSRPAMRKGVFQAMAVAFLPIATFGFMAGMASGEWLLCLTMLSLAAMSLFLWKSVLTDDVKEAGYWVSKSDDIRAVGPLADMLSWPDPRYWETAARGLARLLPKLKASDSALLNESQRQAIYEKMTLRNARSHRLFLEAALAALEQVGDASSVPAVSRLASSRPRNDAEKKIVSRAAECLEALQARLERGDVPNRLLRPAASNIGNETLLRCVAAASEPDTDRLLRLSEPAN